jgi:hypothetical protein
MYVCGWCVLFTKTAIASTPSPPSQLTPMRERERERGGKRGVLGSCRIKCSEVVVVKTEMVVMKVVVMVVVVVFMAVVTSVDGVEVAMKGGSGNGGGGWRNWW